jgi:hypothetical protein
MIDEDDVRSDWASASPWGVRTKKETILLSVNLSVARRKKAQHARRSKQQTTCWTLCTQHPHSCCETFQFEDRGRNKTGRSYCVLRSLLDS